MAQYSQDLAPFLQASDIINFQHPLVARQAAALRAAHSPDALPQACFEFVRDQISHSGDVRSDQVTCKASEVLAAGTGWCFAKSHLLAALLRANGLAAGLCYQRLGAEEPGTFILHGLNAVWLDSQGWYRCDARGNKSGVDAQFVPPREQLAWPIHTIGEYDFPGIYAQPLPQIVTYLGSATNFQEASRMLPDGVSLP